MGYTLKVKKISGTKFNNREKAPVDRPKFCC